MAKQLNPKDLEILSAYLDGQISPREQQRLETRLAQEPALQSALTDLRRTRQLLRIAPQAQRPRSFALAPDMVRPPMRMQRAFSTMRIVSIIASLLFGAIVFGDALNSAVIAFSPGVAEMADMPENVIDAMENQAMAEPAAADDSNDYAAPEIEESPADEDSAPEQADPGPAGEAQPTQVEGYDESGLQATGSPSGTVEPLLYDDGEALSPTASPQTTSKVGVSGETDLPEERAVEEEAPLAPQVGADRDEDQITGETTQRLISRTPLTPLQIVKGGLALLAVVTGLVALVLRKRLP